MVVVVMYRQSGRADGMAGCCRECPRQAIRICAVELRVTGVLERHSPGNFACMPVPQEVDTSTARFSCQVEFFGIGEIVWIGEG